MIRLCPSRAARSISASIPTDTAAVCSRKPTMTLSSDRPGGSRSASPAANEDVYSVGINASVNMARMTSRIASVATTRTMFSRTASCVASVDLPTPVAPPISTTIGTSSARTSSHFRKLVA